MDFLKGQAAKARASINKLVDGPTEKDEKLREWNTKINALGMVIQKVEKLCNDYSKGICQMA